MICVTFCAEKRYKMYRTKSGILLAILCEKLKAKKITHLLFCSILLRLLELFFAFLTTGVWLFTPPQYGVILLNALFWFPPPSPCLRVSCLRRRPSPSALASLASRLTRSGGPRSHPPLPDSIIRAYCRACDISSTFQKRVIPEASHHNSCLNVAWWNTIDEYTHTTQSSTNVHRPYKKEGDGKERPLGPKAKIYLEKTHNL